MTGAASGFIRGKTGGAENCPDACLSVPSWVIPGTYAENLRFLENKRAVEGVELLFFIYDDETRAQLEAEWESICSFRERFVFTAHLPETLLPEHEELVSRLAPLVRHFIVHPPLENPAALAELITGWAKKYGSGGEKLPSGAPCSAEGRAAPRFLVENTFGELFEKILPFLGEETGLCMDTGHLLLGNKSPAAFFSRHRDRVAEIHLHGVDREAALCDGRLADHRGLRRGEAWLGELLPLLKNYGGVINLEVFSWEEARAGTLLLRDVAHNERDDARDAP
ncbi:MAG: AP endonuclease [Treponema sp.]|nr:AP endonuclease [Treponema sp.]